MTDQLYQISFLVHAKTNEPFNYEGALKEVFEKIESDGKFEVLLSKPGGGFYRPTEEADLF